MSVHASRRNRNECRRHSCPRCECNHSLLIRHRMLLPDCYNQTLPSPLSEHYKFFSYSFPPLRSHFRGNAVRCMYQQVYQISIHKWYRTQYYPMPQPGCYNQTLPSPPSERYKFFSLSVFTFKSYICFLSFLIFLVRQLFCSITSWSLLQLSVPTFL